MERIKNLPSAKVESVPAPEWISEFEIAAERFKRSTDEFAEAVRKLTKDEDEE